METGCEMCVYVNNNTGIETALLHMGLENSELFEGRTNDSGELIFKIMFKNVFLASRVKILIGDQSAFTCTSWWVWLGLVNRVIVYTSN